MVREYSIESQDITNFSYCIFDWDDNILMMPTMIHVEHFENGKWIKKDISPKEWVDIKTAHPKYWSNREWRCDLSTAFSEFRDSDPTRNIFLDDVKTAINNKKFGPSWDKFINNLIEGNLFSIVTSRGHEPKTLRSGVEYIIQNVLDENQKNTMLLNLLKYNKFFGKVREDAIENYLDKCIFIGVMSKYFETLFGYSAKTKTDVGKRDAVDYVVQKFGEYVGTKKLPVKIGFSDDDSHYFNIVKELFMSYKKKAKKDFYVFDTSDSKIKKFKVRPNV